MLRGQALDIAPAGALGRHLWPDALEQFAKTHFQIDLDKRKGLSNLRSQVIGLIDQFGMQ